MGHESTARWSDIEGKVPNEGASVPVELRAHHGDTWKRSSSPIWKLSRKGPTSCLFWDFYGGFIILSWFTKSLTTGDWFNLTFSLSSLEIRDWDWKLQYSKGMVKTLWGIQKWPREHNKKCHCCSYHLEILRGLGDVDEDWVYNIVLSSDTIS